MAIAVEDVKKLKVQELREELEKRGLDTSGLKAALTERLEKAIQSEGAEEDAMGSPAIGAEDQQKQIDGQLKATAEPKIDTGAEEADGSHGKIIFADSAAAELEKRKARAARFGIAVNIPEDKKKELRAERFGLPQKRKSSTDDGNSIKEKPSEADIAAALEKKKARAARFNMPLVTNSKEEQLRLKARAERFKSQSAEPSKAATGVTTNAELEAKKLARAKRFGLTT